MNGDQEIKVVQKAQLFLSLYYRPSTRPLQVRPLQVRPRPRGQIDCQQSGMVKVITGLLMSDTACGRFAGQRGPLLVFNLEIVKQILVVVLRRQACVP